MIGSRCGWIAYPLALFALSLGCAGGGESTLIPDALPQAVPTGELMLPATANGLPLATVHLRVDPAAGTVDVSPVRLKTAVGDAYLVGLNALRAQFRVASIKREVTADGARLTLQVEFAHPFSAATRPDLMGWDLKAILATDLTTTAFTGVDAVAPTGVLANATGFTNEWTPEIAVALPGLSSNTFPYVILGEDRDAPLPFDFQNPDGYNCFPAGSTATGEMVLDLPAATILDFDVFFTVGYQVSATRTTRQTPDYDPPRGNARAPWRVDATVSANNLTGAIGSSATVDLQVWDWQHGQSLSSDVTGVTVYAPELTDVPLTAAITGGSGRGIDPLTSTVEIINTLGTITAEETIALIEIQDALSGNNPGGSAGEPGVDVVEDDFTSIRTINDFRTFQVITLPLTPGLPGVDPIACVASTPPMVDGSLVIPKGTTVSWDAACATDPDPVGTPEGTIVKWEWDTDWDGIAANFVDETGGLGVSTIDHLYPDATETHLGLRVTDGVGRTSMILDVRVTVLDRILTLVLDPIVDIQLPPWLAADQREVGACFAELTDGRVELNYTAEEPSPPTGLPGYTAYQMTSYYTPGEPGTWSMSGSDLSSSGGNGILEYGFWLKNCTNWGPSGEGIVLWAFSNREDHSSSEVLYGHNVFKGTLGLIADLDALANVDYGYGFDIASSRIDGSVYVFTAPTTSAMELRVQKGGPDLVGTPITDWRLTVPPVTIDTRPTHVSRVRSTDTGVAGDLHLVYASDDQTALRYARNESGDSTTWALAEMGTGLFGEPAFDLDEGTGAYIAVANDQDGVNRINLYISNDRGLTWQPPILAGGNARGATELSLNVFTIEGTRVIAIGYSTSRGEDIAGEIRLRWSADDGANWNDDLLSTADDGHWPETLVSRTTPDFFAAWSADDGANFVHMQARHGVFMYQ